MISLRDLFADHKWNENNLPTKLCLSTDSYILGHVQPLLYRPTRDLSETNKNVILTELRMM